jgi:hypothetical protein
MNQRLEDRILQLCAKALTAPDCSLELSDVLKELKAALREHTQRIRKMAGGEVPLAPNRRGSD